MLDKPEQRVNQASAGNHSRFDQNLRDNLAFSDIGPCDRAIPNRDRVVRCDPRGVTGQYIQVHG